ncbi:hypothetical protein [Frankia sp. ACN1ag]|uniref:hypothetical protein n=1 Tax=Frankia sp. ACN1ag TaxID=102891 RepID=UPI0006DCC6E1|nr:hypothetical protein [Frankia sp. ACN1ag]KQC37677.1 hypothetical protein UK82_13595 [Frankia sp. ACN1ag]
MRWWRDVAWARERAGDSDGAAWAYRQLASTGDTELLRRLGRTREQARDHDRAAWAYEQIADAGDPTALHGLARVRRAAGDRPGMRRAYLRAVDAGDTDALRPLTDAMGADAGPLLRYGLEPDGRVSPPWW